ncbi:MAG: hypothetical protein IPK16_12390 [Anaerolineales bacterium]|nr:hypothetical protein [Anaerolineales bacterium]
MLIVLQFPISDIRGFLSAATGRMGRPSWPQPKQDEEFIRSFGMVHERYSGGIGDWVDEGKLCVANRAVRIPLTDAATQLLQTRQFRVAFRTFYFDGNAVGKYEIGIATKRGTEPSATIAEVVKEFMAVPVVAPNSLAGKPYMGPLQGAGKSLAQQYLAATTRSSARADAVANKWWVEASAPVVLVETNETEGWAIGAEAREQFAAAGDVPAVDYLLLSSADRRLSVWVCTAQPWGHLDETQAVARYRALRTMRIALLRIHAERECLLNVVRNCEQKRIAPEARSTSDAKLQMYLRDATKRVLTTEAAANLPIVALANRYDDQLRPGERAQLLTALANTRQFVQQGVASLVNADADITLKLRKQLHQALVEAFDMDSLARLTAFELGVRLDVITAPGPLTTVVFNVMQWAESNGQLAALVAGACAQNPTSSQIQAVAAAFGQPCPPPAGRPPP